LSLSLLLSDSNSRSTTEEWGEPGCDMILDGGDPGGDPGGD
jgi:hypothetical protein